MCHELSFWMSSSVEHLTLKGRHSSENGRIKSRTFTPRLRHPCADFNTNLTHMPHIGQSKSSSKLCATGTPWKAKIYDPAIRFGPTGRHTHPRSAQNNYTSYTSSKTVMLSSGNRDPLWIFRYRKYRIKEIVGYILYLNQDNGLEIAYLAHVSFSRRGTIQTLCILLVKLSASTRYEIASERSLRTSENFIYSVWLTVFSRSYCALTSPYVFSALYTSCSSLWS